MVRLEVVPDRWVKGGDQALSLRWADRKSPGSGVLAFNAAAGGGAPRGRGGAGGACAARTGAAGQSSGRERAGALRAPGPRAGSAQEPRECRERAPGPRRSSGTAREPRERRDRAGGAERGGPSAPPAGAAARLGPGSGGQDVRAGEYRPPAWPAPAPAGPAASRRPGRRGAAPRGRPPRPRLSLRPLPGDPGRAGSAPAPRSPPARVARSGGERARPLPGTPSRRPGRLRGRGPRPPTGGRPGTAALRCSGASPAGARVFLSATPRAQAGLAVGICAHPSEPEDALSGKLPLPLKPPRVQGLASSSPLAVGASLLTWHPLLLAQQAGSGDPTPGSTQAGHLQASEPRLRGWPVVPVALGHQASGAAPSRFAEAPPEVGAATLLPAGKRALCYKALASSHCFPVAFRGFPSDRRGQWSLCACPPGLSVELLPTWGTPSLR